MKSYTSIVVATLLALPSALAAGGFTCQSAPEGNRLAYCVYDPVDNAPDGGWPTIISLPGSGARGPASNAKSLAGYDAVGKLVTHYLSGENKDEVHTMAATKFLTIVPISPEGTRHFFPENVLEILNEVKKKYKVNEDKVYCTGYSMGSRGSWRFATAHPEICAAVAPSAGGAEYPGDGTLTQEKADPVSDKLKNIVDLPIRQFAGKYDNTAGTDGPKKTQADLEKLGAKDSSLEIMDTDHAGLSTKPWTDTDVLSWFLKQSRSGSPGESSPSATESSPDSATTTYSPVSPPNSTSESEPEEECEEEDESDQNTTEDDCEEDEAPADDEDDCEDEDETYDDEEDEDCGPEDDEETDSSSADSGSYGSSSDQSSSNSGGSSKGNSYVDNSSSGLGYSEDPTSKDSGYSSDTSSDNTSSDRKYKQYNKSLAQEATTDKSSAQEASDSSGSLEAEVVQPSRRARRGLSANHSAPIRARQHHAHGHGRMVHRKRAVRFGKAAPHHRR